MSAVPNILLITADQLRYDCLGFNNLRPVHTPHIDRLAGESMRFDHAFTHIPLCSPARQSLLTGRRPESFGALWNYGISLPVPALPPESYAWPRELAARGYRNVFIGKWGVNPDHDATRYGYDDYIGEQQYTQFVKENYPDVSYSNGYFGETNPVPLEHARTHWLAQRAVEALEELCRGESPWHLALHFPEPHLPCRPSEPYASMYDPRHVPQWESFRETFQHKPYIQRQQLYNWGIQDFTWDDWAPIVARYYGVISQLDDAIGRVLHTLERLGAEDRTVIIFTADHGDLCGGHRMIDKHYVLYDDLVRVPLLVKWKGVVAPGAMCDRFVHPFLDLPPTILEMLHIDPPGFFHGASLLPLLRGEDVPGWREAAVSTYNGQQFGLYTQRMIRTKEWKYIWNTTDIDELYCLIDDPAELVNRIHDPACAGIVQQLRQQLYRTLSEQGDGLVRTRWMRDQLLLGNKL